MQSWTNRASSCAVATVITYLTAITALTGCERQRQPPGTGNPPAEGTLVVLIGPGQSSPQLAGIVGGARRAVEKYPSLRLETDAPSDNDPDALGTVVRNALSKQPAAVCLFLSDADAARPIAEKIIQTSAILVTMGAECDAAGVFAHVDVGLPRSAELLGESLSAIAADERSYLLLHSRGADPSATSCYNRFMLTARKQYGMKLLYEENTFDAERTPSELIRELFGRFRHAGLVVTLDPTPWLTSPPAESLGTEARFATLGAAPALWPWLRSGLAAALAGPLDGEIGALAVEAALAGITESRKSGMVHFASCELVTPETLDDFATRYAEAAGLDLDELLPPAPPRPAEPEKPTAEP